MVNKGGNSWNPANQAYYYPTDPTVPQSWQPFVQQQTSQPFQQAAWTPQQVQQPYALPPNTTQLESQQPVIRASEPQQDTFQYSTPPGALSQPKPTPSQPVDKSKDGQFSLLEAGKNFVKGLISPVTTMLESPQNLAVGVGMIVVGGALMVATGGAAAPVLLAIGVGTGLLQAGTGVYKLVTAKDGDEAERAFFDVGAATSAVGLSVVGAKASLKGAGNTTAFTAEQIDNMGMLTATVENIKAAPTSFGKSVKAFTSGEFVGNIRTALGMKKAATPAPKKDESVPASGTPKEQPTTPTTVDETATPPAKPPVQTLDLDNHLAIDNRLIYLQEHTEGFTSEQLKLLDDFSRYFNERDGNFNQVALDEAVQAYRALQASLGSDHPNAFIFPELDEAFAAHRAGQVYPHPEVKPPAPPTQPEAVSKPIAPPAISPFPEEGSANLQAIQNRIEHLTAMLTPDQEQQTLDTITQAVYAFIQEDLPGFQAAIKSAKTQLPEELAWIFDDIDAILQIHAQGEIYPEVAVPIHRLPVVARADNAQLFGEQLSGLVDEFGQYLRANDLLDGDTPFLPKAAPRFKFSEDDFPPGKMRDAVVTNDGIIPIDMVVKGSPDNVELAWKHGTNKHVAEELPEIGIDWDTLAKGRGELGTGFYTAQDISGYGNGGVVNVKLNPGAKIAHVPRGDDMNFLIARQRFEPAIRNFLNNLPEARKLQIAKALELTDTYELKPLLLRMALREYFVQQGFDAVLSGSANAGVGRYLAIFNPNAIRELS